jgi:hypothetical protein
MLESQCINIIESCEGFFSCGVLAYILLWLIQYQKTISLMILLICCRKTLWPLVLSWSKMLLFWHGITDWKECKKMCQSHRLSLLKIDDYNELVSWALIFTFILGFCLSLLDNKILKTRSSGKKLSTFYVCVFLSAMWTMCLWVSWETPAW